MGNNRDSESDDVGDEDHQERFGGSKEDDYLSYRPDPKSMLDDDDGSSIDNGDEDVHDGNSNEDEDDDLAAARATFFFSKQAKSKKKKKKKKKDDSSATVENNGEDVEDHNAGKKYVAPRLTAVPYTHDVVDKQSEKEKRQRRKLRATELAQALRQQYGDQPEAEDLIGG